MRISVMDSVIQQSYKFCSGVSAILTDFQGFKNSNYIYWMIASHGARRLQLKADET